MHVMVIQTYMVSRQLIEYTCIDFFIIVNEEESLRKGLLGYASLGFRN